MDESLPSCSVLLNYRHVSRRVAPNPRNLVEALHLLHYQHTSVFNYSSSLATLLILSSPNHCSWGGDSKECSSGYANSRLKGLQIIHQRKEQLCIPPLGKVFTKEQRVNQLYSFWSPLLWPCGLLTDFSGGFSDGSYILPCANGQHGRLSSSSITCDQNTEHI